MAIVTPVFTSDAHGTGPRVDQAAAPIAYACANRMMSLQEEPRQPTAEEPNATANRPLRLPKTSKDDDSSANDSLVADIDTAGKFAPMAPAVAATGTKDGASDALIESIVFDRRQSERIRVSRNATAVINLKEKADSVSVADPNIADVYLTSPERIVVTGRGFGTTQLLLKIGEQQRAFHIDVELDLSLLNAFIKSVAPSSKVEARSVNGTIYLNGTVPDTDMAKQITDMAALVQGGEARSNLTVAGVQQTMIRVVVAEVNKSATRQLGVNWAVGASDWSRDFFFTNNLGGFNPTTYTSSGVTDVLTGQNLYSVAPVGNAATGNVTFGFPRAEFQVFMNALRENTLARTLAEPNLVAISGQTASFLVGGEVPLSVVSSSGGSSNVSVYYKEFGIRLGFTPTVLGQQLVRLHVMSEVSEPIPSGSTIGGLPVFSFETRRVETTIECGNGQTFAIAGLLSEQVQATASKIPGLGDVPILGTLFSSTRYEREETELVVLVTPQLVAPLDPHQVPPPPGRLMTDPTDAELFGLQKLEGEPLTRPVVEGVPRETYPVKTRPGNPTGWPTTQLALRGPWGMAELEEN